MPNDSPFLRFLRGPWVITLTLFLASLALFTRDNEFLYDYHPDEDGKTHQILQRERNYHHPLLLLNVTDLVVHLGGVAKNDQAVVIAGRWVSAAFAAGAVALLALIGYWRGGWLAAWSVGLLVATHAELYKAAHYLKEDSALLFGLALFFVAVERFTHQPTTRAVLWLGVAAGSASAGKYIGILVLLFALPLVWRARELPRRWKTFFVAFGLTFLILNLPPARPANPFKSLKREVAGVTTGHRGLTRQIPHARYVEELRDAVPTPLLAAAGVYLLGLAITARRRSAAEWTLVAFPLLLFAILSCSPKTGGRYLLPVSVLACAFAGLAAVDLARLFWRRNGPFAAVLGGLIVVGGTVFLLQAQAPSFRTTIDDFKKDDRVELAAWIREHLPPDAFIVEDHRVNLFAHRERAGLSQQVFDADYAADFGTIDELLSWGGAVYVAVSPRAYDRFFGDLKPRPAERADFERRREFYRRLFAEAELVWEKKSRGIMYLQPGLKLYRLKSEAGPLAGLLERHPATDDPRLAGSSFRSLTPPSRWRRGLP